VSKAGDKIENPVTGERIVVRVGTEDSGGELLAVDVYVRPGGAVTGEHVHPTIEESFMVVRGRVGFRIDGRESIAELHQRVHVPAGVAHYWWNAGEEEAHIIVEISPGERFEKMARKLFGLAQDGKTNSKGMPNLLQGAIFAREFSDVLYFTKPPLIVQRLLFGALAVIARALGYRGSYTKYSDAPELLAAKEPAHRQRQGWWRGRSLGQPRSWWHPYSCSEGHANPLTSGDRLYSPSCLEEEFSQVRMCQILRSSVPTHPSKPVHTGKVRGHRSKSPLRGCEDKPPLAFPEDLLKAGSGQPLQPGRYPPSVSNERGSFLRVFFRCYVSP
jgi:quercetin dioxygenase-like cupin family protein